MMSFPCNPMVDPYNRHRACLKHQARLEEIIDQFRQAIESQYPPSRDDLIYREILTVLKDKK